LQHRQPTASPSGRRPTPHADLFKTVTVLVPPKPLDQSVKQAKVLIVDDEEFNGFMLKKHLQAAGFERFVVLDNSIIALDAIRDEKPDLVILDVMMPMVSGLDILQVMSLDPALQSIPALIMTASTDAATKHTALELGAADFLSKPIDPHELVPRVRNTLTNKLAQDRLKNSTVELERLVRERTTDLVVSREEVVHCLARACEYRDNDTGQHIIRVGRYVGLIAHKLGFPQVQVENLDLAARLHDIGKIAIPDDILRKPGKLEPHQIELMRTHCQVGKQIIEPHDNANGKHAAHPPGVAKPQTSPLLTLAAKIAHTHHEWWDGSGYPLGLSGQDIPIEGRIVAIADVFDALNSKRPYKPAYSSETAFELMAKLRGKQFDPQLLDLFFRCGAEIAMIQRAYADHD
jgi:putative two-component system response regulator